MITEGYLARHHMGRRGMHGPALLDVAQDYALQYLHQQEVFDLGVVLKGGTSIRKFRAGNAGRFSTDLDFAAPDVDTGELLIDTLDGATIEGVTFAVTNRSALRGTLDIDTPLGRPDIPARIEVTPRPLWLPCDPLEPISLPVHRGYEFKMPALPAPALVTCTGTRSMLDVYVSPLSIGPPKTKLSTLISPLAETSVPPDTFNAMPPLAVPASNAFTFAMRKSGASAASSTVPTSSCWAAASFVTET